MYTTYIEIISEVSRYINVGQKFSDTECFLIPALNAMYGLFFRSVGISLHTFIEL